MATKESDVMKLVKKLDKKLTKNNLEVVYKELNHTVLDNYFKKYTVKQIKEATEDEVVEEVAEMLEKFMKEPPFSLLTTKMTEDDFCLQAALITKFIQEN